MIPMLRPLFRLFLAGVMSGVSALALAADWPERSVRVIVAYPPGGVSDAVTRAISDQLSERMKASFVVENKGGAGGTVAMAELAKAKADGHTLVFSSISPLSLSPLLRQLPYDANADIQPVAGVMVSPVVLLGTPAFSGKAFADILAQSKASPGALRWATSGQGSIGHLMLEQLQQAAGIELTHIPYKGAGQQLTDGIGGQYELISTNMSAALTSHITSGVFKPLAVAAPARLAFLPDTPTFQEVGFASTGKMSVFGFFAPAGTPQQVVDLLNGQINQVVQTPAIQTLLAESHNLALTGSPAQFAEQIAADATANRTLIEQAGLKFE